MRGAHTRQGQGLVSALLLTALPGVGTPEAQGKAEYLTAVVSSLNRWQASTLGLSSVYQWLHGSLQLHQNAIREVGVCSSRSTSRLQGCGD